MAVAVNPAVVGVLVVEERDRRQAGWLVEPGFQDLEAEAVAWVGSPPVATVAVGW